MTAKKISLPAALGLLGLLVPVGLLYLHFGCPILYLTGISCPGCGMTRAVWAALHLDFRTALAFHPLVPLLPLAVPVWLLRNKMPHWLLIALAAAAFLAFCAVYLLRLLHGSSIVYARPEEGAIARFFSSLSA